MKKADEERFYEYCDMIDNADSIIERIEYINKALEIKPDDLDLNTLLMSLQNDLSDSEKLARLDVLIEKEEMLLRKNGYFKDDYGDFWAVHETRPYMRALAGKVDLLIKLERIDEAIKVADEMTKLCENDNLGMRYILMGLYAETNDEKGADELLSRTREDRSINILLPYAYLLYRKEYFEPLDILLDTINMLNKFILPMVVEQLEIDEPPYFQYGSVEEAIITYHSVSRLEKLVPDFSTYLYGKGYKNFREILESQRISIEEKVNGKK